MWLPADILKQVDDVADFRYVDAKDTKRWNAHRRDGELRLLTGWAWTARDGSAHRQGFKSVTVAYRDAYYSLIRFEDTPAITRRARLRVVARRAA